jgi:multidrug resistance efflux pump
MPQRARIVLLILLLALIAGAAFYFFNQQITTTNSHVLGGSGYIEADKFNVATDVSGRVVAYSADEGDTVQTGQELGALDAALLNAQVAQAQAALALAQANLDKVKTGARAEEIAQAQAALEQAKVKRDGAKTALADAQQARVEMPDLELKIDQARGAITTAEHRAQSANLMAQAASLERAFYERTLADLEEGVEINIPTPGGIVTKTLHPRTDELRMQLALAVSKEWNAWVAAQSAQTQVDGARTDLNNLLAQKTTPLTLNAQANAAQAALDAAEAGIKVAEAKLTAVQAPPRAENIAAAQAQVAQAQAALDALNAQLAKTKFVAPRGGLVIQRYLNLGEMASAGTTLFQLADLDRVTLTVYIPEDLVGNVRLNQTARVTTDSFPNRMFTGTIVFISPRAEFTPKNVATKEQRETLVFAVKIQLANPDHALKPGMPADALLE